MPGVIEFLVFDHPIAAFADGRLLDDWGVGQTFFRSFPLVANPPPDTLLMKAMGADFSVFGEDIPSGGLQIVDHQS